MRFNFQNSYMDRGEGGDMNHDYYFSKLTKQMEKDFFKEIHGIDFDHRNNLAGRDIACKENQGGWNVGINASLKKIWSIVSDLLFIHSS